MTDIVEVEPGVYSVLIEGASFEARVSGDEIRDQRRRRFDSKSKIRANGNALHRRARPSTGRASITAPMPGKVVRVLVAVGDEVEAGQGVDRRRSDEDAERTQSPARRPRHSQSTSRERQRERGRGAGRRSNRRDNKTNACRPSLP